MLINELAGELVSKGHQAGFIICSPSYPAGIINQGYQNSLISDVGLGVTEQTLELTIGATTMSNVYDQGGQKQLENVGLFQ